MSVDCDLTVDARDLLCPLPVLKARKTLNGMQAGQVLCLWATDPVAVIDIPHFCVQSGHEMVETYEQDGATAYVIRRGAGMPEA